MEGREREDKGREERGREDKERERKGEEVGRRADRYWHRLEPLNGLVRRRHLHGGLLERHHSSVQKKIGIH